MQGEFNIYIYYHPQAKLAREHKDHKEIQKFFNDPNNLKWFLLLLTWIKGCKDVRV